jgi:heme/copper-type cytochrome/quinol oxidase subunit 3
VDVEQHSETSVLTGAIRDVALKAVLNREIWHSPHARKPNPVPLVCLKTFILLTSSKTRSMSSLYFFSNVAVGVFVDRSKVLQ